MTTASPHPDGPIWMIDRFAQETPGVVHALLLGADGLKIAASPGLDFDLADKTAATASSLMALAAATSREYGAGNPEILTFRTPEMHFLVMAVADRGVLAVVADRGSNLSVIGNHMSRLVNAVGVHLNPAARSFATAAAPQLSNSL